MVPESCTKEGLDKVIEIAKKNQFETKTDDEVKEFIEYRQKKAKSALENELVL
jgi:hypothetical protein